MKLRSSTKILLGFIGLAGLSYGGSFAYTQFRLKGVDLHPIASSDLCLLAIGPKAGVKILVANQMVQVVEASSQFGGTESSSGGAVEGAVKKRIPVRELVGILGGDVESAQSFIDKMRDTSDENQASQDAPLWPMSDIKKAINGDQNLKSKLEHDLNVTLDGKPLPVLNRIAFFYGIRIKVPVKIVAKSAISEFTETFDVVTFKPRVITTFYRNMQSKFYDPGQLQEYYASYLKNDPQPIQEMAITFESLFQRSQESEELAKVQRIASNSTILVNQSMIEKVDMVQENDGKVPTYGLNLRLTSEGKNRLWKFSNEGGTQILVISKGVAIAAATIGTQLNSEDLVIKQIADRTLVEEAVSLANSKSK